MTTPPARTRVSVPLQIKAGDIIEIRTRITHVMETGQRRDKDGAVIPRNIINSMTALYRNKAVFSADLHASTSANPFIAFQLRVTTPGPLVITWTDDKGQTITEKLEITFTT
jgi:sulfur-oxidizing protein SoxZ